MDESAQRDALAGPFDPCVRQRGSWRGAGLVQALIVERLSVAAFQYMLDIVMVISGLALLWQATVGRT